MKNLLIPILLFFVISVLAVPHFASAQTISDGQLITTAGSPDIYIVKIAENKKFKRLILNPIVFENYGHLKWEDVKEVDPSLIESLKTSDLVRAHNDYKVYELFPQGDYGKKKWIKTSNEFEAQGFDWEAVYEINGFDRDSYAVVELEEDVELSNSLTLGEELKLNKCQRDYQVATEDLGRRGLAFSSFREQVQRNYELCVASIKSGSTPAKPAKPAIPAQPGDGSASTTPATPAVPATPATPAVPQRDTTPPIISDIQAVNVTENSATITWTTDEPSDSKVIYS